MIQDLRISCFLLAYNKSNKCITLRKTARVFLNLLSTINHCLLVHIQVRFPRPMCNPFLWRSDNFREPVLPGRPLQKMRPVKSMPFHN